MAYTLHCVLARAEQLTGQEDVIELSQNIAMIPIVGESGGVPTFERLSPRVEQLCETLSRDGIVAYVEAEYFGGAGDQRAVVWTNGMRGAERIADHAINEVLRMLGVDRGNSPDEFDAVGLGKNRHTQEW